jgi:hypothetical protein
MTNIGTGLGSNPYEDILFINDDDTRIGINVENPVCTLDVDGDINADYIEGGDITARKDVVAVNVRASERVDAREMYSTLMYAYEQLITSEAHILKNILLTHQQRPFEYQSTNELGEIVVNRVIQTFEKPLFTEVVQEWEGLTYKQGYIDYSWIINGPSSENLPDKEDMEGWLELLNTILTYAGIAGTLFGLANLLTAGAAGNALSDAAKSVLCGLKSILGLGSCGPDGGEDGDDGADGDSPDLGSIYLPISRITDSGLIYFRDLDSIPFLNPFNPNDPTNYYSVSTDMGIRNNLFFKTTKRVYLTHESCFENIQKNRERNRATISSTMRWELFSFPERKMNIETISFDSYDRTNNPLVFDEGSYSDYSQTSKAKINGNGIYRVSGSSNLMLLDIENKKMENMNALNMVSAPNTPILKVGNIVVIDENGNIPASRIIDDNLISLADGEVNMSNRTARFTSEIVQNSTESLMELMNTDVQMYENPVFDELLPTPEPWTIFDTSIELPDIDVPLRAVMDSWVHF